MIPSNFETRMQWIRPQSCTKSANGILICEEERGDEKRADDNYSHIVCTVHGEAFLFRLEKDKLSFLTNGKCADHIILEKRDDGWHLHVIECKRSVGVGEWKKVKEQFEGAVFRALAIMGILAIMRIESMTFYTAFRNDKLTPSQSANPYAFKKPLTTKEQQTTPEVTDWHTGLVGILGMEKLPHHKIQLDQTGHGEVVL